MQAAIETPAPSRRHLIGRNFIAGSVVVHLLAILALPGLPHPPAAGPMLVAELRPAAPTTARVEAAPLAKSPGPATPPDKLQPAKAPSLISTDTSVPLSAAATPSTPIAATPPAVTEVPQSIAAPVAALPTTAPSPTPTVVPPAETAVAQLGERRGKPSTLWLAGYTKTISGQVSRLKRYPSIAVLRGWEGTAVIAIQLAADGTILHVGIEQSSGHQVLDAQALSMVRQAEPLPPYPQKHEGDPLIVRLPIVFALASPG